MSKKRSVAILTLLFLFSGCAKTAKVKKGEAGYAEDSTGKATQKEVVAKKKIKYDNEKYKDKLLLSRNGIYFAHSFDCMGAYDNRIMERTKNAAGKLLSYTQIVKCSVTGETHALKYYNMKYNETEQKIGYDMELTCTETKEQYLLTVIKIGYDFYWEVLTYKAIVGDDTLIFPEPKKPS